MEERIWSNPEMKGTYYKMALTAIIFSVLAVFYFGSMFENFNKDLINKNIAAAGILIQKHPELKDDIIKAFTSEAGMKELQTGIAAAVEYGYTDKLPISVIPLINRYYITAIINIVIFSLICFLSAGFIIYSFKKKIYIRVRETANAAEKIIEGDFNVKLNEKDEGDFSKLGHQFNQMAKRLELTMEQLKNEKIFLKNIISDISHQLKTPLSSIKIFNEILSSDNVTDKNDWDRFLYKSGEQIERMEWLIQNLLVMARIEAGAVEFANEYKSLNCTVINVIDSFKEKFKLKNINVNLTSSESEIYLLHDDKWMGEAIGNIVKNSIEHTGINGNICIETSSSPVMIRVVIKDDGEGICSEDLPNIFKRFYKGRNNLHGSGTGIGLALSKAIIESQGGMIGAASTLNKGTAFTITFPNLSK